MIESVFGKNKLSVVQVGKRKYIFCHPWYQQTISMNFLCLAVYLIDCLFAFLGIQIMLWGSLPNTKEDNELSDDDLMMEECCR